MNENEISYIIRRLIFNVCNKLGPALLESVYHRILVYELKELERQSISIDCPICENKKKLKLLILLSLS
ncbi:hypothetical protein ODZ84_21850 [Chryseobacterium fluminis]|uniref:GxxExxY protein n=1 Tax=Chryseobacterium fluminis TaxID=2983606 RepID=UPI00224ECBCB|nr:GxxExxY protein [Chryseobacterium sp. MMS21-Ot14]UZT97783.1 hypothetical protein ODZ84_21850 [Chryseobacterium sp. MMS21-Ot14]